MLPFLKPKNIASTIISSYKPEGKLADEHEEGDMHPELMKHAESLISAVHAKDAKAVAEAMQAMMEQDDAADEIKE
jgi:hypothetical protein